MLSLKIDLIFLSKTCGNVKIFLTEDWQKNFLPRIGKRRTLEKFLRKLLFLLTTSSIEHTVMIDFKM